jgi:hypothetical protein
MKKGGKMKKGIDVGEHQNSPEVNSAERRAGLSLSVGDTGPMDPNSRSSIEQPVIDRLDSLVDRMARIEGALEALVEQRTIKDWYSTAEVAKILNRAEFTVREWCRLGRVHAKKRACGRGQSQEWIISHDELQRIRNEGLISTRKDTK